MSTSVEKFHEFMDNKSVTKESVSNAFDKAIRTMEDKFFLDKQAACWKHEPILVIVKPEIDTGYGIIRKDNVYISVCTLSQSNSRSTIQVTESSLDELIKALVETRSELSSLKKAYNEELEKLAE